MKGIFKTAGDLHPGLAKCVKEAHDKHKAPGHIFDHDLRAGNYALIIAPDERTAILGAAAGLCHSVDRLLRKNLGDIEVRITLDQWLSNSDLDWRDKEEVIFVVVNHEGPNKPSDTPVQITLNDADRLANLDADVIIRSGQFHPDIFPVEPYHLENDPQATYHNPRSVLWDIKNSITWTYEEGPYILRLPKARELGKKRAAFLELYIETIREQRKEAGLIPFPMF